MRAARPLVLSLALAPLAACAVVTGDGEIVTQDREVSGFSSVTSSGVVDVEVYGGSEETAVSVTCDANLQDWIDVEVQGTTLEISERDRAVIRPSGDCVATVVMGAVGVIESSGSGDVFGRDLPGLAGVHTSGSGEVDVGGIDTSDLEVSSSGSGDVRAEGAAVSVDISTSGSGEVDARALTAESVRVRTSGSGDVRVSGSGEVDARSSGSGDIHVYGDPTDLQYDSSGSGSVVLH